MSATADALVSGWARAAAPPPDYTVSEWADANRFLPKTSGAQGGRWQTDAVPYLRGIMDAVHEPGVASIALMKCSQIGGSEALLNIIGYHIEHAPCPILLVQPSGSVAEEFSKERLGDMIRNTPALTSVVRTKRDGNGAESTLSYLVFPNGFLALGGANTPNTFARRAARLAAGDDVDRFPAVVGEEGDPLELLKNRTESFYDGISLAVSTPTLKNGRIDTAYQRSDQRRYFVRCPVCGRWDYVTWNDGQHFRVAFDERDAETARLQCPDENHGGCGAGIDEADRRAIISRGEWRPTAVPKEAGAIGFHLPAMLSTIGARTLQLLAEKWLTAREKGKEALRVFINTQLAQGWEERGKRMDPQNLLHRREDYGQLASGEQIEVPAGVACLTCGVDVQGDRIELQVQGWGMASQRWVIDYVILPGSPKQWDVWAELLRALERKYLNHQGHQMAILATCIDSGWSADEVYTFVLKYQGVRRLYATKGYANRTGTPIVGKPAEKRSGKSALPVQVWPLNVDDAKRDIFGALTVETHGPGSMYFPLHVDTIHEEYFAQLCAEHEETKYNKAKVATHSEMVQDRERNEALDTAVGCLGAVRQLNPNYRQMLDILEKTPVARSKPEGSPSAPPAPAAAAPTRQRRHSLPNL